MLVVGDCSLTPLAVIAGEVPREGHPNFHASDLFDIWNETRRPSIALPGPVPIAMPENIILPVREEENETEVLPLVRLLT